MTKKLLTLKQHRTKFRSDSDAAKDLGLEYMTYRRWLNEKIYSPEGSAWRMILAEHHAIDLPHRKTAA